MQEQFAQFIRDRITELRLQRQISEHQMGYDLDKSRSYVYNISSGNALPSLKVLLTIVEYFDMSLAEFFDDCSHCPPLVREAIGGMRNLNTEDMEAVLTMIGRLCVMRAAIEDLSRSKAEPQVRAKNCL